MHWEVSMGDTPRDPAPKLPVEHHPAADMPPRVPADVLLAPGARGTQPVPAMEWPRDETPMIAALAEGDHRRTLTLLMQAHGTAVYQHCRLQLRDAELARDVHQEVFIAAYHALAHFEHRSSLRTWLFGIAQHRCLDAARRRQRARRRLDDRQYDDEPSTMGPLPRHEQEERDRALEACLSGLSAEGRLAVLQRHREELSYEEMSRLWDLKVEALRMRVSRALRALRECLQRKGVEP